jgi:Domain of unknown function (DUF4331)
MSSHREAPEISQDPVADNTDTYAFVSPDQPDTVTIITNYIPLEAAAAGPNFYEFGQDVRYYIYVSNDGSGEANIAFEFAFTTTVRNPNTFLYNTGPITSIDAPTFNRYQTYTVTQMDGDLTAAQESGGVGYRTMPNRTVIATDLLSPPCNIGPASTPNYPALAQMAVHSLPGGITVFAGQRNDGFFADLGAIFDLGDLRPIQEHHAFAMMADAPGIDTLKAGTNVHTIAMQIPITKLTRNGTRPSRVTSPDATIGIWGAASRRKMQVRADRSAQGTESGPWVQVSRLGNPLFNEVLVGMGEKDLWNRSSPVDDKQFVNGVLHPGLAELLPTLYPAQFPNLAMLNASGTPRVDLEAILLTGLPPGIVPGFTNYTGNTLADMLRLNVAVPPSSNPSPLGLLGGDAAGFPNGRRVTDDVVTIELRALAGVTYALVDSSYSPDPKALSLTDGVAEPATEAPGSGADPDARFIPTFPYLGTPHDGFDTPPEHSSSSSMAGTAALAGR